MKIIKIENSYNIDDKFSDVSFDKVWFKLSNYINNNKNCFNKAFFHKEQNSIIINSLDSNKLLSIIKNINPKDYIQKYLIRSIKLNLKFNKESKRLDLANDLSQDLNNVNYNITYKDPIIKNDIFFSEDALLINYENLTTEDFNNIDNCLAILFFTKIIKKKDLNNEIISEDISDEYMLLLYDKNTKKLKSTEFNNLNKENEIFNLSLFISKYNNNEQIPYEVLNVNDDNNLMSYKFTNLKLAKTSILINGNSENDILDFKNTLNKYVLDNFINLEYERNTVEIN